MLQYNILCQGCEKVIGQVDGDAIVFRLPGQKVYLRFVPLGPVTIQCHRDKLERGRYSTCGVINQVTI